MTTTSSAPIAAPAPATPATPEQVTLADIRAWVQARSEQDSPDTVVGLAGSEACLVANYLRATFPGLERITVVGKGWLDNNKGAYTRWWRTPPGLTWYDVEPEYHELQAPMGLVVSAFDHAAEVRYRTRLAEGASYRDWDTGMTAAQALELLDSVQAQVQSGPEPASADPSGADPARSEQGS